MRGVRVRATRDEAGQSQAQDPILLHDRESEARD